MISMAAYTKIDILKNSGDISVWRLAYWDSRSAMIMTTERK